MHLHCCGQVVSSPLKQTPRDTARRKIIQGKGRSGHGDWEVLLIELHQRARHTCPYSRFPEETGKHCQHLDIGDSLEMIKKRTYQPGACQRVPSPFDAAGQRWIRYRWWFVELQIHSAVFSLDSNHVALRENEDRLFSECLVHYLQWNLVEEDMFAQ